MGDRQRTDLHPEEQAFLTEAGLRPDDLAYLVADAPPLPAEALDRIHRRVREKAGIAPSLAGATTAVGPAADTPSRASSATGRALSQATPRLLRHRRRWLVAAVAALLLVSGTVVVSNPEGALAAIQRLVRLVPGIGLTETDEETWILSEPVSVERGDARVTVTGAVASREDTWVTFRAEWPAVQDKQSVDRGSSPPVLRLPDGTELRGSGHMAGGGGSLEGSFWYDPLPVGTHEVVLVLPFLSGTAGPVEIPLSLVQIDEAGLAEAHPGTWSAERLGVKVGVPYWTATADRIVIALGAQLPEGVTIARYGDDFGGEDALPTLTDDQGRVYPLLVDESPFLRGRAQAVFQGPLAPDASTLTLTVPALTVEEHFAQARLTVPLVRLPEGEPLELNEELAIGDRRFTVRSVTRLSPRTFRFDLDLGPEVGGAFLQSVSIEPPMLPFVNGPTGWSGQGIGGQITQMEVDFERAPTRNLTIVFASPTYRLSGRWEVQLPVTPSPSADG